MAFVRAIVAAYRRRGRRPGRRPARRTDRASANSHDAAARITARQIEALSRPCDAGARRRGARLVQRRLPWGSYGMLCARLAGRARPGRGAEALVPPPRLLTDDIVLGLRVEATASRRCTIEERRAAGARSARVLPGVDACATCTGWPAGSSTRASRCSERAFPLRGAAASDAYALMFPAARLRSTRAAARHPLRRAVPGAAAAARREARCGDAAARALPLTVLQYRRDRLLVQRVREALAAQPGRRQRRDGRRLLTSPAHPAPPAEGRRRQPAAAEGRGAPRARASELLLAHRPAASSRWRGGRFPNEKSFTRAFRQWTGTTPGRFRSGAPD